MRSYEAARSLFSFLAFIAWSVIILGVLVGLIGAGGVSQYAGAGAGMLAMIPGIGIGIGGFILLAFVQMGRAGVDTAEYTQQMLKVARDQLEVSRQGLKGEQNAPKRFEAIKNQAAPATGFQKGDFVDASGEVDSSLSDNHSLQKPEIKEGETILFQGQAITQKNGQYITGGEIFSRLLYAKSHIERSSSNKALAAAPVAEPLSLQKPASLYQQKHAGSAKPKPSFAEDPTRYKGKSIIPLNGQYLCDGIPFKTLQAAQSHVDNFSPAPVKPFPGAWKS